MIYDVSIVTVTHNDLSDDYLRSIDVARKASKLKIGLVIVDNASKAFHANERVHGLIKDDVAVILRNGDFGFGKSCNRGAQEFEAKYVFFLNPDTVLVDPLVLDKLFAFAEAHPDVGITVPKVVYPDGSFQETCRRFPAWFAPFVQRTGLSKTAWGQAYAHRFLMRDTNPEEERNVDWAQGSALFISQKLFNEVEHFDDRFWMYYEDVDLCRKVGKAGKQVRYVPSAVVAHAHGKASARPGSQILNVVLNPMARAHLKSWAQYSLKWLWKR